MRSTYRKSLGHETLTKVFFPSWRGSRLSMLIFVDTEFTDLHEPYLISMALVAADGAELYCEMVGITQSICSQFVRDSVLPLMSGPQLTPIHAAEQVLRFLAPYPSVVFFCDAPGYDVELLKPFLPQKLLWTVAVPSFETEADEMAFRLRYEKAFETGLRRHHALDDARALCRAWSGSGFFEQGGQRDGTC